LPTASEDVVARVQRLADGVPFLVEESLAAPGVPVSFAEAVRARLTDLNEAERLVVHTAALFGRQFDWRLLPRATGLAADEVAGRPAADRIRAIGPRPGCAGHRDQHAAPGSAPAHRTGSARRGRNAPRRGAGPGRAGGRGDADRRPAHRRTHAGW